MTGGNVLPQLPLFDPPRQKAFREAVSRTINAVKAEHGLTNVTLAEEIACCADTISNAENQNNDLSAVILLRLAYRFGEAAIAPVRALYQRDISTAMTAAEHRKAIEYHAEELARLAGRG